MSRVCVFTLPGTVKDYSLWGKFIAKDRATKAPSMYQLSLKLVHRLLVLTPNHFPLLPHYGTLILLGYFVQCIQLKSYIS